MAIAFLTEAIAILFVQALLIPVAFLKKGVPSDIRLVGLPAQFIPRIRSSLRSGLAITLLFSPLPEIQRSFLCTSHSSPASPQSQKARA